MLSKSLIGVSFVLLTGLFASTPSSTNYNLKSYDVGGGGGGTGSSTNFQLNSNVGTQTGNGSTSTNFNTGGGETVTQNANIPPAPSFSNPSSEYNRLRLIINTGNNPSDSRFAVAISNDNFVTTQYIKSDFSIGNTLTLVDYQTYASWGSGSGVWVTGLASNTTYEVKAKALQGNFTETAYGPTASAATVLPTLSFSVATSLNPTPPFSISFTSLTSGSVQNADADAALTLSSNGLSGGDVYIKDANSGLTSSRASYTISSATADLSVAATGYGAIVTATSQSSGGPISAVSPFNGAGNNVGILTPSIQRLLTYPTAITNATATVRFKAKAETTTPSSSDYVDTLTFIAAISY